MQNPTRPLLGIVLVHCSKKIYLNVTLTDGRDTLRKAYMIHYPLLFLITNMAAIASHVNQQYRCVMSSGVK